MKGEKNSLQAQIVTVRSLTDIWKQLLWLHLQIQQQSLEQEVSLQESIRTVQEQAQQQLNDMISQLKAKVNTNRLS